MTVPILRSTSIKPGWLWYDFGDRRTVTGIGLCPVLRNTVQNTGPVLWLPLDLVPAGAGDKEPDAQVERDKDTGQAKHSRIDQDEYFGSPPVVVTDPPPIEPPSVVIPPPVDPPPVEPPPPVVKPTYKIKNITRTKDFPTIVFFGVAAGLPGKLVSPGGVREQPFVTGNKPEFGDGGTEAGAGVVVGDYTLIIGADSFIIPIAGQWTKIEFETATDMPPVDDMVVVVTKQPMVRSVAVALLAKLEAIYKGVFRVE